jgi:hypothetical protein
MKPNSHGSAWLSSLLARNASTAYLQRYGSPRSIDEFRARVPIVDYADLHPWIERIRAGESDVLFAGRPVAFERTSGSSSSAKLIPYSREGLDDFRSSVSPWLARVLHDYGITGRAYFSISPATREAESIGGIPVGLPDEAYVGDLDTAVPFEVAAITDVAHWRRETLRHLAAASDLELISVWSPTFLLRLLDDLGDPQSLWPRLRVVSCWASGASKPFAEEVAARLPQAHLQPKGLLSTETVVTIPDSDDRPVLTRFGFFEFERDGVCHLEHELTRDSIFEVIATTASGLYRYRTGDLVRYDGQSVFEFIGRGGLVSDLVGEKLTEPFVAKCLEDVPGFRLLVPHGQGYALAVEEGTPVNVGGVEMRLCENPQYAYARRIGQLDMLRLLPVRRLFDRYAQVHVDLGSRLGDVKPAALRNEREWVARLQEQP